MAKSKANSKSTDAARADAAWEKHWGKRIPKGFVVHHKDGNPTNNSLENLKLISRAESNRIHKKGKTLAQQEYASKNKPNISNTEPSQRRFR